MYSNRRSLFAIAALAVAAAFTCAAEAVFTVARVAVAAVFVCVHYVASGFPRPSGTQILMLLTRERERQAVARAKAMHAQRSRPVISRSWRMCASA